MGGAIEGEGHYSSEGRPLTRPNGRPLPRNKGEGRGEGGRATVLT
jgi:hypothetical protein